VRVILIGYSYGADRAIQEATALYDAIASVGMVPEIHLRTIDAVDRNSGLAATPTTKGPENMKSFKNTYQTNSRLQGGPITNVTEPDIELGGNHDSIDDDVLSREGFAREIAGLELAPFGNEAGREVDTFP
jgi:hypothetical protein